MADILVYALHYEGAITKNSLGAVSAGARLASELGGECHAIVGGGDDLTDEHAFEAAADLGGAGVLVGPRRATAARFRLDGVAEVAAWLRAAA